MKDVLFRDVAACDIWRAGFEEHHGRARVTLYATGIVTVERRGLLFGWKPFALGQWRHPDLTLNRVRDGRSLDDGFWYGWVRERIFAALHVAKLEQRDLLDACRRALSEAEARMKLLGEMSRES